MYGSSEEKIMLKRAFDIFFSTIIFVILMPLFIVVAFCIKVTSRGPVFFCQKRVGLNGKDFTILKFRSMTTVDDNDRFDAGNTSRVTSVGKIIRKLKIDELPQLLNVIVGSMSLVGPRPEIRKWVNAYPIRWKYIHQVRPGITDMASIKFRNEEEELSNAENPEEYYKTKILPEKLDLYEKYVKCHSILMDIHVLLQTLKTIIIRK
jgi:lipopolysaccharide/colanic/teichoic acid biosynthesis glycosyltransferase